MPFSELELKRIEKVLSAFLAKRRPPAHVRQQMDLGYRLSGQSVELFEIRPQWDDPSKIHEHPFAKATYVKTKKVWKIYWRRADLKWHGYEPLPFSRSLEKILAEIDQDPNGCFWG